MKHCPQCGRSFTDETLRFCLYDGKPLSSDTPPTAAPPVAVSPPPTPVPPPVPVSAEPPAAVPVEPPPAPAAAAAPPPAYAAPPQYTPPYSQPPAYNQPYGTPPKKSGTGWKWTGGIVVLLLLMRIGLHNAHPANPSSPPSPTKSADGGSPTPDGGPSQSGPPDSDVHDSLVSAIHQADTAQVQALGQADPAPLYASYSGPALQKQLETLQKLKDTGILVEGRLLNQDIGTFTVNADRSEAQVDVTETWSLTFYSAATHKTLRAIPSDVSVQTLLMKRSGEGWAINDSRDKP